MIFHSLDFAIFFLVVFFTYWALPHRAQNFFLLLASYFFYGYVHPWFLILLAASTVIDYSLALAMTRFPAHRRVLVVLSLTSNLGLLCFFKYFGFFVDNVMTLLTALGFHPSRPALQIVLPVGISFYTFQTLSYTIDVYRGRLAARRNFLEFSTFLALFPQLVAGPIERATRLLPQVESPRHFDPDKARSGLLLMCWGLFKKVVVADNVALIANKAFSLSEPGFSLVWVGTLAFAVQIYSDFSAYSDIARGSARLLGFELMKNFDHPYVADSPTDFWRRWHISLSTWFRDYVYIPLGGNRGGGLKPYRNLMVTFLLSGFWHGASWNFVLWGGYHGLLLALNRVVERRAPLLLTSRRLKPLRILLVFGLVNVGWLMFRETDIRVLLHDLSLMPGSDSHEQRLAASYLLGTVVFLSLPILADTGLYLLRVPQRAQPTLRWALAEGAVAFALIVGVAFFASEIPSDFIYFQF